MRIIQLSLQRSVATAKGLVEQRIVTQPTPKNWIVPPPSSSGGHVRSLMLGTTLPITKATTATTATNTTTNTILQRYKSTLWIAGNNNNDDDDDDDDDDKDNDNNVNEKIRHQEDQAATANANATNPSHIIDNTIRTALGGMTAATAATTTSPPQPQLPPSPSPPSAAVPTVSAEKAHQRIWLPHPPVSSTSTTTSSSTSTAVGGDGNGPLYWSDDVVTRVASQQQRRHPDDLLSLLDNVVERAHQVDGTAGSDVGGRKMMMRERRQCGVLHEDPAVDMRLLTENYTVHSLASALRDREEMLQYAAQLATMGDYTALQQYLKDCHPDIVLERRKKLRRLDLNKPLNATSLETIRKGLMRMPRRVTVAHSRRAGVVIPLIHVNGVPSVLLEKRATHLRAHPDEVCLPGGMVCEVSDRTIVETCLREMKEEIDGFDFDYHHEAGGSNGVSVLGILRCNWGEVHHLVGVAVTPVVCFFNQDLAHADLRPNPDEVAELFTIPLATLLDRKHWVYKDDHAPIFVGGPYVIWGLTGYILERFWKDILQPFDSNAGDHPHQQQLPQSQSEPPIL